jgi:hypothetical protein
MQRRPRRPGGASGDADGLTRRIRGVVKRVLTTAAEEGTIGAALLLACMVVFVTACSGRGIARTHVSQAAHPSSTELLWRRRVAQLAVGNPLVPVRRLAPVRRKLAAATIASGGRVVRLAVRRGPTPAPELVIAAAHPARYLKHRLQRLLLLLRDDHNLYLAVIDEQGRPALEWSLSGDTNPNHGSLYVRPGLERCSPIVALGWPSQLPPCPEA